MGNQNAKALTDDMNAINTKMQEVEKKRDDVIQYMDKIMNTLIKQQSYQDMIRIQDENYCNKLTGEMKSQFEQLNSIQIDTLFERITGNASDVDSSSKCLIISEFYVTIYYIFNAVLDTIYRETNDEDGKFNLCLKRLRQFILEVTTDDNVQNITIGYRCSDGFDKETLPRLQDELGISSLKELYYDTYTLPVNNQSTEEEKESMESLLETPSDENNAFITIEDSNPNDQKIDDDQNSDDDLNESKRTNTDTISQTGGSELYGIQRTMSDASKLLLEQHTREFDMIFNDNEQHNGILHSHCDDNNKGKSYSIPSELLEDAAFKTSIPLLQEYASSLKNLIQLNKNNIDELEAYIGFSVKEGVVPIFVNKDADTFRINPELKIDQLRETKTIILEKIKNIYNSCQADASTTMTALKKFIESLELEHDIVQNKTTSITETEENLLTSSTLTNE